MYSSTLVANNILSRAFEEGVPVTPSKLQRILWFTASEYQKAACRPLLEEPFFTRPLGPLAISAHDKFRAFGADAIDCYARDARGDVRAVAETRDALLRTTLDRVWHRTKFRTALELSHIARLPDSAWDRASQTHSPQLAHADVAEDLTYRMPLAMWEAPVA